MDYKLLSGADLAFIGDAYFELYIRDYVLNKGYTKLKDLHQNSVRFVSRNNQYTIIKALMDELTDEEKDIFKRGRNYDYKDKSVEYVNASGFEALVGYLYLKKDNDRLEYIMKRSIEIIENKE